MQTVTVQDINFSNELPFVLIGGMNVIESRDVGFRTIDQLKSICEKLNIPFVAKFSWSKRNRSSIDSYSGVTQEEGVVFFEELKKEFEVPIITDVHLPNEVEAFADVVDILQLPAFLARQSDIIEALAKTGKAINIKKPQFMGPDDIKNVVQKFHHFGNKNIILCERGTLLGLEKLVVDMLGFGVMKKVTHNAPICFDATHSLQARSAGAAASGGRRNQLVDLSKAGLSTKIASLFIEAHPDPDSALCDGPSAMPLDIAYDFLSQMKEVDSLVKSQKDIIIA